MVYVFRVLTPINGLILHKIRVIMVLLTVNSGTYHENWEFKGIFISIDTLEKKLLN